MSGIGRLFGEQVGDEVVLGGFERPKFELFLGDEN